MKNQLKKTARAKKNAKSANLWASWQTTRSTSKFCSKQASRFITACRSFSNSWTRVSKACWSAICPRRCWRRYSARLASTNKNATKSLIRLQRFLSRIRPSISSYSSILRLKIWIKAFIRGTCRSMQQWWIIFRISWWRWTVKTGNLKLRSKMKLTTTAKITSSARSKI